ncbi:MAG: 3-methyl-2-oxobutanoate hydroxymethyltransferase [bacterium]
MPKPTKITLPRLQKMKDEAEKITMLTAYDYPGAKFVDEAGVEIILVGDSLAMTVLGHANTVQVTMEEMLHHCKAVARGAKRAFLIGDMPFLSYQAEVAEAIRNAGRFLKEAGMDAVKLESGRQVAETIRAIIAAGIPVMGHVGLTPQSATQLGGFKIQGKTAEAAMQIYEDALLLEQAGCFAIVLEAVPETVAQEISRALAIPTIGIGAGAGCDGQVLVFHDLLGLFSEFSPQFVKKYADLGGQIVQAIRQYCKEVKASKFPGAEHVFKMDEREYARFLAALQKAAKP